MSKIFEFAGVFLVTVAVFSNNMPWYWTVAIGVGTAMAALSQYAQGYNKALKRAEQIFKESLENQGMKVVKK